MTSPSVSHFNEIANKYDYASRANPFSKFLKFTYLNLVLNLIKKVVPEDASVLDFGCGTGEVLNSLKPKVGVGFDPSLEMIKIGRRKFGSKFKFVSSLKSVNQKFDYIIMADVIEHLENPLSELTDARKYISDNGSLVISYVDSSWEPFLNILEAIKLKIPEGPNNRISVTELIKIVKKAGFKLKLKKVRLLITLLVFERQEV